MEDLADLAKWQAMSHPDLAERTPEELFAHDFAQRYRDLHRDLWRRLTRLHGTVHTLEQLEGFPFHYLYAPTNMQFWGLVIGNFFDTACLMLHGLVNDAGTDVHTIPTFRDAIVQGPWGDQRLHDLLVRTLHERKFDGRVKSVASRVDKIRDNRIAHHLIDKQTGCPKHKLLRVSLEELRLLFDAAHSLFGALCFGAAYITRAGDLMPTTIGGVPTRTCLDEVLDAVLRENYFVNQPERCGNFWPSLRERIPREDLQEMNELRRRVGLPEA